MAAIGRRLCPTCRKALSLHTPTLNSKGLSFSSDGKTECSFRIVTKAYIKFTGEEIDMSNEFFNSAFAYFLTIVKNQHYHKKL